MKAIFLPVLLIALNVHAEKHEHKNHKAHQHGAGTVSIAFDGLQGQIDIEVPTESIYGFEHAAQSDGDKKKQTEGLQKLETDISKMIVFADTAKCVVSKESVKVNQEGKHADIDASFHVKCEKDLTGSEITFNIQNVFPRFSNAEVQVVVGDIQKSVKANRIGTKIDLKK